MVLHYTTLVWLYDVTVKSLLGWVHTQLCATMPPKQSPGRVLFPSHRRQVGVKISSYGSSTDFQFFSLLELDWQNQRGTVPTVSCSCDDIGWRIAHHLLELRGLFSMADCCTGRPMACQPANAFPCLDNSAIYMATIA